MYMLVFAGVKRQELYKVIGATLQPCNIITKHTVIINDNNRSSLFACLQLQVLITHKGDLDNH